MKSYLILVEMEDFINVDAESEEDAIQRAIEISKSNLGDFSGTVMSSEDIDEEENEDGE